MNKIELLKLAEQEVQWLKYYSTSDSRKNFDPLNIYNSLERMKYSKRQMPLHSRCAAAMVTSDKEINENSNLDDLRIIPSARNTEKNIYTALEVFLMLFPEENHILNNLNS